VQITYPGPDGQLITIVDPRDDQERAKSGKVLKLELPAQRRPAGWLISAFVV
jgi:hypothetical protein